MSNPHLIENREELVAALRERGIDYLAPSDAQLTQTIDDKLLVASLAAHSDPRLRQALIALFLIQPRMASIVERMRAELGLEAARQLMACYQAAVYLQRVWMIRLKRLLPDYPQLPDLYSAEMQLPDAEAGYGEAGLHALAEQERNRSPQHANCLSEFEGVADLLFQSLKQRERMHEPASQR